MSRKALGIFIAFVTSLSFLSIAAPVATAGPYTSVYVTLAASSVEVDVSPGSTGVVDLSGTCVIQTRNAISPIQVTLIPSATEGASVTVTPAAIVSYGNDQVSLAISIKMQPLTSRRANPVITIGGTWVQGGYRGDVGPAQCQVIVKPYYLINVYAENPYLQISPADSAVFSIKLFNMGNDQDNYVFEIENEKELVGAGWTLPPIAKLTIDEKMQKTITWTVQSPQKWRVWENKVWMIRLIVKSENSKYAVKETYSLFVRTKGIHIPGFEPALAVLALAVVVAYAKIERKHKKRRR